MLIPLVSDSSTEEEVEKYFQSIDSDYDADSEMTDNND